MLPKFLFLLLQFIITTREISSLIEDNAYWQKLGMDDIKSAMEEKEKINATAKNVIVFIGDGMGPTTVTAARIYSKGVDGYLSFEKFPYMGTLKTYSIDQFVPDSCSTATALFCGVKANTKTCGVDLSVKLDDCEATLKSKARMPSIIQWAQEVGKSTGFVTTTRVTHATPSALYSHSASRRWECDTRKPISAANCKDIARQLIEDLPGRNIQVIMGGGRQCLKSNSLNLTNDPLDTWACISKDGRDLFKTWEEDKLKRKVKHKIVTNNQELSNIDVNNTDYVLGIFSNSHLKMNYIRDKGPKGMPSLTDMTEKALKILQKNTKHGYLLVVEGGLIDFAHHRGHARKALDETLEFDNAIARTVELTENVANETLIIVTSDHAHSMVFTGYAKRNESVLGIASKSKMEDNYHTSLLYGTGGPNNFQYYAINNTVIRANPLKNDTLDFEYSQQAAVLTDEVLHDGTDVYVHAKGPMAHLFHKVHEQTYVAYVIGYAAKMGPFNPKRNTSSFNLPNSHIIIVSVLVLQFLKGKL